MTQDERWQLQYEQVMVFMEEHHKRPSKYCAEERLMWNWFRRNAKLMNRKELTTYRSEKFMKLMEIADKYRRVNQYI